MGKLYETINMLCEEQGIKASKLCADIGISRGLITDLKMGRKNGVTAVTAQKIASYFGVSVGYLLGEENKKAPTENGERSVSDDDIKFALFGGDGEITDEMYERVKQFAAIIKLEEAERKKE